MGSRPSSKRYLYIVIFLALWLCVPSLWVGCSLNECEQTSDCSQKGSDFACVNENNRKICKEIYRSICNPTCKKDELCIRSVCKKRERYNPNKCDPECGQGEICHKGSCTPKSETSECKLKCDGDEICIKGKCMPRGAGECEEICKEHELCVNNQCTPVGVP